MFKAMFDRQWPTQQPRGNDVHDDRLGAANESRIVDEMELAQLDSVHLVTRPD